MTTLDEAPTTGWQPPADTVAGATMARPEPVRGGEQAVYLACSAWILAGLCLDGWAHRYVPELETFFTPWHAVFYAGFTAVCGWLAWMVLRRRPQSPSLTAAIPVGYGLAVVGLGLFALGGVGDGIWHTIFGVESSLDALLSPTHLLMLVGALLGTTAPIRSARAFGIGSMPSRRDALPIAFSAGLTGAFVCFFLLYANGFSNWAMSRTYIPGQELEAAHGVMGTLITTVVLLSATFYVARRWRTPVGTFVILFSIVGVFLSGLDAFANPWQILAPVIGGLTADLLAGRDRGTGERWAIVVGLGVPLVMWSVATLALHLVWEIRWPPELWAGQIVLAMLAGLGLAVVTAPASVQEPTLSA